jgi:CRP-like cAMP-binding protein
MQTQLRHSPSPQPVLSRLGLSETSPVFPGANILKGLDAAATAAFATAIAERETIDVRQELVRDGATLADPLLVLDGWAAKVAYLPDGRRQLLGFVLPGEFVGAGAGNTWTATSTIVAITRMTLCQAPPKGTSRSLDALYAASGEAEERGLIAHIVRLGQLSAYERIRDLLVDLSTRLSRTESTRGGRFHCPLTQDMLADAVGMTSVHVNRTLQALRRNELIVWRGRDVTIDIDKARKDLTR